MQDAKNILFSKTFWFNTELLAAELAQILGDFQVLPAQHVALGLAIGNVFLRVLTKVPVTLLKN